MDSSSGSEIDNSPSGGLVFDIDRETGVGIAFLVIVALPAIAVFGTLAKTLMGIITLLLSALIALGAAKLAVRRSQMWRRDRRRAPIAAAAFSVCAGYGIFALMPATPAWFWCVGLGLACLPGLFVVALTVTKWRLARALAKGEQSADQENMIWPEARTARWAELGERYGWTLNDDEREWSKSEDAPLARRSFAGVVDMREWRARWQRAAWQRRPGTPERPGTPRIVAPDAEGVWAPKLLRQVIYGASGHGKSVLLTRWLAYAIQRGADVLIIDGKGAASDADTWELAALRSGVPQAQIKRWPDEPLRLLDGMSVSAQTSLLAGLIEAVRGGVGHAFYEGEAQTAIAAALRLFKASGEPVSLAALLDLLEAPPLSGGTDADMLTVEVGQGLTRAAIAAQSLRPVVEAVGGGESETGWPGLPEPGWWSVGIVSANVQTTAGAAVTAALLQRLAAGVGERSGSEPRPLFIIVDEAASVLTSSEMAQEAGSLLSAQGRSAKMPCTWTFQDRSQIPEEWADAVETSAELMWVGATKQAARYLEAGGNRWQEEATRPGVADKIADTSVRAQTAFGLRPSVLETLPLWCWGVYAEGAWTCAFAPPLAGAGVREIDGKGARSVPAAALGR